MLIFDYVIPILSLAVLILSLGFAVYVVSKARRFLVAIVESVQDFFEADAKTGVSPYSQSITNIVEAVGTATGSGVTRAINGSVGGSIKAANAEARAQLAEDNPEAAMAMQIQAALPRNIQKNNLLTGMIVQGAMKALGGGGGVKSDRNNNHNSDSQSAFNI